MAMAKMETDAVACDSRLAAANQIKRSSKVYLNVIVNSCQAHLETGTVGYFLWRLFRLSAPLQSS